MNKKGSHLGAFFIASGIPSYRLVEGSDRSREAA